MTEEIWKPVVGYEGLYEVSNLGRVRSLAGRPWGNGYVTKQDKILKMHYSQDRKYYCVRLHNGKSVANIRLHQLVAKHFCKRAEGQNVVNHINGNKFDDRADNLEWTTMKGNFRHALHTSLVRDRRRPVGAFDMNGVLVYKFDSIRSAVKNGFDSRHIFNILGKNKIHKGFYWKEIEQYNFY